MLDAWKDANIAAAIALFGVVLLGLAARLGRFFTLPVIEDFFSGNSDLRSFVIVPVMGGRLIGARHIGAPG